VSAESWAAASAVAVSLATLGGTVYTARAGRRTRGQERRDDFTTVTDRMERELERLGKRVDEQELESATQKARISGQDYTIRYLAGWVRSLVGFVQTSGLEPPPIPEPIPEEVRPYLRDLGV
jgi:hypothetical protein